VQCALHVVCVSFAWEIFFKGARQSTWGYFLAAGSMYGRVRQPLSMLLGWVGAAAAAVVAWLDACACAVLKESVLRARAVFLIFDDGSGRSDLTLKYSLPCSCSLIRGCQISLIVAFGLMNVFLRLIIATAASLFFLLV
jgi:hypothetical protein